MTLWQLVHVGVHMAASKSVLALSTSGQRGGANPLVGGGSGSHRRVVRGTVVHGVRVPLTSTTMAEFWAYGVWLGLFCEYFTDFVYHIVDYWGPLYPCAIMGPHPGNVARLICVILCVYM